MITEGLSNNQVLINNSQMPIQHNQLLIDSIQNLNSSSSVQGEI